MKVIAKNRLMSGIILFLSVFFLPWWMTSLLALATLLIFPSPYEVLFIGIFLDALYVLPQSSLAESNLFFIISAVLFLLSFPLKERITLGV